MVINMEVTKVSTSGDSFGPRGDATVTVTIKLDMTQRVSQYAYNIVEYKSKGVKNGDLSYHVGDNLYITYMPRFGDFDDAAKLLTLEEIIAYGKTIYDSFMDAKDDAEILARRNMYGEHRIMVNIRTWNNLRVDSRFYVTWEELGEPFDGGIHVPFECTYQEFMEMSDAQYYQALDNAVTDEYAVRLPDELAERLSKLILVGNLKSRVIENNNGDITDYIIYTNNPEHGYVVKRDAVILRAELNDVTINGVLNWVVKNNIPGYKSVEDYEAEKQLALAAKKPAIKAEKRIARIAKKQLEHDWIVIQVKALDYKPIP